jgi:hypothetical protein
MQNNIFTNTSNDNLVKIAKSILERTNVEEETDDEAIMAPIKKLLPSGAAYQKYNNSLYWEKSGGYAGEKSLKTAREKLEKAGFKYSDAKTVGLPDGSTSGFKTYLYNKKLGLYATFIRFYGQTSSSNRYSITVKKVETKE